VPLLLTDQMQREVILPQPALRIVSLVPSQTELLFALGAGELVVGATKFCTEPPEQIAGVSKVGGTKKFDFEAIAALKPDLIIGNKEENYAEGIEQLAVRYPVWMSDIVTLEDALEMIQGIGVLASKKQAATQMANTIAASFSSLAEQSFPTVNVAYLIWQKPYMAAATGTFIDEMLQLGGMSNVFSGLTRYPEVSLEKIRDSDAAYILLSSEPFPFREKHRAEFAKALPEKQVVLVDAMPFSWYGSQLLRTAAYLQSLRQQF